jgi:hypothetical protein
MIHWCFNVLAKQGRMQPKTSNVALLTLPIPRKGFLHPYMEILVEVSIIPKCENLLKLALFLLRGMFTIGKHPLF